MSSASSLQPAGAGGVLQALGNSGIEHRHGSFVARRGGARKPVVDGFAEAFVGNAHGRDAPGARAVEGAQQGEEIGRRFNHIAARAEVA